jgi:hypothetical protein
MRTMKLLENTIAETMYSFNKAMKLITSLIKDTENKSRHLLLLNKNTMQTKKLISGGQKDVICFATYIPTRVGSKCQKVTIHHKVQKQNTENSV